MRGAVLRPRFNVATVSSGGAAWRANEPGGMTLVDERPFNTLAEHASPHDPAWDTDIEMSIVTDATAPQSPSNVIRETFPTGFVGGASNGHAGVPFTGYKTLYSCYAAKYSSNWWGHLTGVNKQVYIWANGGNILFFEATGTGTDPLEPRIITQATPDDTTFTPNITPTKIVPRGTWFQIEILLVGNTVGASNGTLDWWVDGIHSGSYTGVTYTTGATLWDIYELRPVWGGAGDSVPATMTIDWDDIYISGKN